MDNIITINFGSVVIRQTSPFPGGVQVWDGNEWVPWETGSSSEQDMIREMVRANPIKRTMPDHVRSVVFGVVEEAV